MPPRQALLMALLRMLPLEANDVASSEGVAKDVLAGILVAALLQDLSYTSKTALVSRGIGAWLSQPTSAPWSHPRST